MILNIWITGLTLQDAKHEVKSCNHPSVLTLFRFIVILFFSPVDATEL